MGDCLSALWSARGEGGAAQQNLEQQRQLLGATWTPDSVAEATQQQLETTQRGMHAQKQLLLALRDQALSTEADGGLTEEQNDPAAADQQRFRLIMERNPIVRGQAEVIVKRYNALRELAVELLGIMSDQVAAEAGTQRTQLAQFSAVAAASTLQSALMVADDGTTLTGEAARRAVAAHLETAATERQHQSEVRQMVAVELDQRAREGNSAALTQPVNTMARHTGQKQNI
jgi:hypothetical protein